MHLFAGLAANSQVGSIWVGAAQFGLSKEYENVDKTPFDYENWPYGIIFQCAIIYETQVSCKKQNLKKLEFRLGTQSGFFRRAPLTNCSKEAFSIFSFFW